MIKTLGKKKFIFPIFIFIISLVVYYLTSAGKTPYDYFTRLAASFLKGKYYLTENPPWLSELIQGNEGKYYFVNPPMPAFLSMPFIFMFGQKFQQQYLAHIIGAAIIITVIYITSKIKKDIYLQIFSGLLIGFGNIIWFLSSVGSVWYLGQICAVLFIFLALYESLNKKRPVIVGSLLSFAFLSRLQTIPCIFFFLYLLKNKLNKKGLLKLFVGLSIFVIIYGFYNFIRFGKLWETGYTLIPNILNEPWFNKGQFSFYYIPKHLKIFFTGLPVFSQKKPFIYPSLSGLAIWLTTPTFIFSLSADIKKHITKFAWLTIFFIALINFSYGSTGYTQFGYRYAVDFYPFLSFLTIKEIAKYKKIKWVHWLFLLIGILVNFWGVIFINKFNWVGF